VDPDAEAISYLAGTVTIRQHSEYFLKFFFLEMY
jgi:hypothetical protein